MKSDEIGGFVIINNDASDNWLLVFSITKLKTHPNMLSLLLVICSYPKLSDY
jgi:hypothetical protein